MSQTPEHDAKIAAMTLQVFTRTMSPKFKKGRTLDELHQVLEWLTGFNQEQLHELIEQKVTKEFFEQANVNPNARLITGSICGYKIQEIQTRLTRESRYMDKLVDELAKGKKLEKILRTQ